MTRSRKWYQRGLLLFIGLAIESQGFGQTYQFTTPASGGIELNVSDFNGGVGNSYLSFSALTETVIYDPINQTLRQMGYITVSGAATTATINETQQINGQNVSATATVQQAVSGGIISFDSGIIHRNASNPSYPFFSDFSGGFQINGSYSLNTGGQTYMGAFTPAINFVTPDESLPYYSVAASSNPNTIVLSGSGGSQGTGFVTSTGDFPVTASNGVTMNLYSGAGGEHDHYNFTLETPTEITANLVPEPSATALFVAGILSFIGLCKKNRT